MQTAAAPEVGRVYVSRSDPALRFLVEAVYPVDAEDGGGWHVEACAPGDEERPGAAGLEITWDEWCELVRVHGISPEEAKP